MEAFKTSTGCTFPISVRLPRQLLATHPPKANEDHHNLLISTSNTIDFEGVLIQSKMSQAGVPLVSAQFTVADDLF